MHSILGNGNKRIDCTSDKQHKIKIFRNIASVQGQGPNRVSTFAHISEAYLSEEPKGAPLQRVGPQALPTNIRLGWEKLTKSNALVTIQQY
jgi:hypothetical protein